LEQLKFKNSDLSTTDLVDIQAYVEGLYRFSSGSGFERVFGPDVSETISDVCEELSGTSDTTKPAARKIDGKYIIWVPVSAENAFVWRLVADAKLNINVMKSIVEATERLIIPDRTSTQIVRNDERAEETSITSELQAKLIENLGAIGVRGQKRWLRNALETISQSTGWTSLAAIHISGSKSKRVQFLSDQSSDKAATIKVFTDTLIKDEQKSLFVHKDKPNEHYNQSEGGGPEFGVYCTQFDLEGFAIGLPKEDGIGLYAEGNIDSVLLKTAQDALSIKLAKPKRQWYKFGTIMKIAACLMLLIALAWPVKFQIGAPGELLPANSRIVVIPYEAQLVEILKTVGSSVIQDEVIAKFTSTDLIEGETQATLDQMLETLGEQEALASGDYSRFKLAEQRRLISEFRAFQSKRRVEALDIKSPANGKVAEIIPGNQIGSVMPSGTLIAEVQLDSAIHIRLKLSLNDGPYIKSGMTGTVLVRGIAEREYPISIIEDPVALRQENGQETLSVLAKVEGNTDDLFKGLSGFAQLNVDERPRFIVWMRPVYEYARFVLWKYLGLHL